MIKPGDEITPDVISTFIEGHDPMERIVDMEYDFRDSKIKIYYRNEKDEKCIHYDPFYPFLWAKRSVCVRMCGGDRAKLKQLMSQCGIGVQELASRNSNGEEIPDLYNGYKFKFYAKRPMTQQEFNNFFSKTGCPLKTKKKKGEAAEKCDEYLSVTPVEQHLISSGKRFFKGYDDYDQILRLIFDLETEGLDPKRHRITQVGVHFNRPFNGHPDGFERIFSVVGNTKEELDNSELEAIDTMLRVIYTFQPDVITAHNGETFDWCFIIERCNQLGVSFAEMSRKYLGGDGIHKENFETSLKLGGEVQKFKRTVVPGIIVTDSLHATWRAQATNSNFLKADLKYATDYLRLKKKNRVYTPGSEISNIWKDMENHYAFNDKDGDWYFYDPNCDNGISTKFKKGKEGNKPFIMYTRNYIADGYAITTGRYIIERYLLDDLYECDKVESALNSTDFMLTKILPISFSKATTMGTAGQWKMLMMAWSFENALAIPNAANTGSFTGGLSRLLCTGYVNNVVKLDYNSLYPSIILTWAIQDEKDISNVMLHLLEYVLTTRETHKKLKKKAGKIVNMYEKKMNENITLLAAELEEYRQACSTYKIEDNRQASVKKLGNSYFGAFGSNNGKVYPWKAPVCAERTTCTGRQSLRLMISHFHDLGYQPIVGDSFLPDTPMFIKYKDTGYIDIKPIEELINEQEIQIDALGREYDYSKKPYKVLCRSGWMEPSYIYRHKTDKDIYEVTDGNMKIEVTQDHSLFNNNHEKIKPSDITENTELEYYDGYIGGDQFYNISEDKSVIALAKALAKGDINKVPIYILNAPQNTQKLFYNTFMDSYKNNIEYSKSCLAGLQYIKRMIV